MACLCGYCDERLYSLMIHPESLELFKGGGGVPVSNAGFG